MREWAEVLLVDVEDALCAMLIAWLVADEVSSSSCTRLRCCWMTGVCPQRAVNKCGHTAGANFGSCRAAKVLPQGSCDAASVSAAGPQVSCKCKTVHTMTLSSKLHSRDAIHMFAVRTGMETMLQDLHGWKFAQATAVRRHCTRSWASRGRRRGGATTLTARTPSSCASSWRRPAASAAAACWRMWLQIVLRSFCIGTPSGTASAARMGVTKKRLHVMIRVSASCIVLRSSSFSESMAGSHEMQHEACGFLNAHAAADARH